jgi:hypothetical protein
MGMRRAKKWYPPALANPNATIKHAGPSGGNNNEGIDMASTVGDVVVVVKGSENAVADEGDDTHDNEVASINVPIVTDNV